MGLKVELEWKIAIRSFSGMPRGGDAGVVVPFEGGAVATLIDATGHGLAAYAVAQKARRFLLRSVERSPDLILYGLDAELRNTIGAAISVARIEPNRIEFAGIGNVKASVNLSQMTVRPGIVGQRMRSPQVVTIAFEPNTWLIMHTDGVSKPSAIPSGSAGTVAQKLLDQNGSTHDDAGILVARWKERTP